MVLLIQVPLKQKYPMYLMDEMAGGGYPMAAESMEKSARKSDVEEAVIGSGEVEGVFTEIDNIAIERDPSFPVRVTVQFYMATATGVLSQENIDSIYDNIRRVYEKGDAIGSLVTGGGKTGRITEYEGAKVQPADWWERFWQRYETNTGIKRNEAKRRLINLVGKGYEGKPVTDLYLRDLLRE